MSSRKELEKVWVCTGFTGHYPVGTAAIVRAKDKEKAAKILNEELIYQGLSGDATAKDMIEFCEDDKVTILCDGNY
jgi:hypothetical protein